MTPGKTAQVPDSERPQFEVEMHEGYNHLQEQLITECAQRIAAQVAQAKEGALVVLNFTKTQFVGSRVLEVIFAQWQKAKAKGVDLRVRDLNPFCAEVFEITKLDKIIPSLGVEPAQPTKVGDTNIIIE